MALRTDSTFVNLGFQDYTPGKPSGSCEFFVTKRLIFGAQVNSDNRVIGHPRGKMLGGSSAINLMFWTHASQADINDWGELGNEGWSWNSLLPYFVKSEKYDAPSPQTAKDLGTSFIDPSVHGEQGPVVDAFPETHKAFQEAWWRTYQTLGLGVDGDPRGGLALGGFTNPITGKRLLAVAMETRDSKGRKELIHLFCVVDQKTRTRSHAGVAYYKPVQSRPNLHVITEALVQKVDFENKEQKGQLVATGLKFNTRGKNCTIKANKEVIISTGAFESPKILELSGIGSTKILKKYGIDVIYENEYVGENLQDHALIPLAFEAEDGVFTFDLFKNETFFNEALTEYITHHTGPLSDGICSSALLSYAQILPADNKNKLPKGIDTILTPAQAAANPGLAHQHQLTRRKTLDPHESSVQHVLIENGMTPALSADAAKELSNTLNGSFSTLSAILEHPFSRGSVHITSSDPAVYPIVNPNYLGEAVDLEIFADALLQLQTVARTEPMASLFKRKGTVYMPGFHELNETNVRAHVKNTLVSEYHPCSTCSMLPRHKGGVVDERLKVYGTSNLRVVDASIFPLQVRANRKFI